MSENSPAGDDGIAVGDDNDVVMSEVAVGDDNDVVMPETIPVGDDLTMNDDFTVITMNMPQQGLTIKVNLGSAAEEICSKSRPEEIVEMLHMMSHDYRLSSDVFSVVDLVTKEDAVEKSALQQHEALPEDAMEQEALQELESLTEDAMELEALQKLEELKEQAMEQEALQQPKYISEKSKTSKKHKKSKKLKVETYPETLQQLEALTKVVVNQEALHEEAAKEDAVQPESLHVEGAKEEAVQPKTLQELEAEAFHEEAFREVFKDTFLELEQLLLEEATKDEAVGEALPVAPANFKAEVSNCITEIMKPYDAEDDEEPKINIVGLYRSEPYRPNTRGLEKAGLAASRSLDQQYRGLLEWPRPPTQPLRTPLRSPSRGPMSAASSASCSSAAAQGADLTAPQERWGRGRTTEAWRPQPDKEGGGRFGNRGGKMKGWYTALHHAKKFGPDAVQAFYKSHPKPQP
jgi:hypothetical protein